MAEHNQQFDSFAQWVNKAPEWLTGHKLYSDDQVRPFRALCFDAKGRLCTCGGDMSRANKEEAFPVRWIWPDQVWDLVKDWSPQ